MFVQVDRALVEVGLKEAECRILRRRTMEGAPGWSRDPARPLRESQWSRKLKKAEALSRTPNGNLSAPPEIGLDAGFSGPQRVSKGCPERARLSAVISSPVLAPTVSVAGRPFGGSGVCDRDPVGPIRNPTPTVGGRSNVPRGADAFGRRGSAQPRCACDRRTTRSPARPGRTARDWDYLERRPRPK
jgi:hypothetical protein